jgi:hypothetical protein
VAYGVGYVMYYFEMHVSRDSRKSDSCCNLRCLLTVEGRHAQEFDDHVMSKTDDSDRIVSSENFQVRLTSDVFYMMCRLWNGVHGPLILLLVQEHVRLTVKKYSSTLASLGLH